ncbi:uncharacterized protein PGTG_14394 [Puccinia graminis f. sp. tritici CRL 75-36-700-3]|uniref:Chaperone DnaJ C-terminal domain-containing protein n=1 Tax=Puccinia graminis f. sp. tritici (strain CRL 75-36-700-3 / race SCCL) TaxID=418459 RepID=E3KVH0_PUCGT|nr:uncharacterized protein PGTG_14394 [Puccinia graminis f. sp. tritici CRL 75-36-700-3]EFP88310.1 hypothetical protein PGTG_14394 [Puccinia graminis f. sp. tritici CRL 75-36-700-3]
MPGAGGGGGGKKDMDINELFDSVLGRKSALFPDHGGRQSGGNPRGSSKHGPTPRDEHMNPFDNGTAPLFGDMRRETNRFGDTLFGNGVGAPQDTFMTLELSLKDLYLGVVKGFKFTRRLWDGKVEKIVRKVDIKPGWKDGTKIRFEGLGDEDEDGRAGALVFVVAQKPDPKFKREGDDLIYTHTITLAEALAGPEPEHDLNRGLKHLDGRNVVFKLPHIGATGGRPVWPGFEIRIPGQGMPITRKSAGRLRGDLRVQIHITFPAWLSAAQIQAARQLKECRSLCCSFTLPSCNY